MKSTYKNKAGKQPCPCIKEPFEECYCSHMDSQKVEDILKYCNGEFRLCSIFKRKFEEIRQMYPDVMKTMVLES